MLSERLFGESPSHVGQLTMAQKDTRLMMNMLVRLDSMVSVRYLITRICNSTMEARESLFVQQFELKT